MGTFRNRRKAEFLIFDKFEETKKLFSINLTEIMKKKKEVKNCLSTNFKIFNHSILYSFKLQFLNN